MEPTSIANEINARINRLEELVAGKDNVPGLDMVGLSKAAAIAQYEKALAITMLKLAHGKGMKLDDIEIKDKIPATLIPKIAAGICESEKLDLESATVQYKSLLTKIEILAATLNAKQSIFRHLSHE